MNHRYRCSALKTSPFASWHGAACRNIETCQPKKSLYRFLQIPSESLTVEHKSWLDMGDRRSQAILAKAAIALVNHGGGIIIFGMRGDDADRGLESHARGDNIGRYRQDDINAAINRYAEGEHFAGRTLRDKDPGRLCRKGVESGRLGLSVGTFVTRVPARASDPSSR